MRKTRVALARRHVKFLAPLEARFGRDYRALVNEMKRGLTIEPGKLTAKLRSEWKGRVVEAMRPAYRATIQAAGRDFLTRTLTLRKGGTFDIVLKRARKSANVVVTLEEQFADRLEETVDTTFDALEAILDEAETDGLDDDEIADLVEEEWGNILGQRTDAIALTETNGAANAVRDYLMREVVEMQDWITAGDERVRPTHVIYGEAGAKPVGFDWSQLVDDAGYTLRYPCDPACHEPSEVVNCRCFTAPAGEVDMSPEELRDFLDDFEMDPEDVMLSEEQTPVYVVNQNLGKEPSILDALKPMAYVRKHLPGEHDQQSHAGDDGSEREANNLTGLGRALVGAPANMNSNPADFEPIVFGKTQVGEKRSAAVTKAEAQFTHGVTLKSPSDGDIKVSATREQMEANLERLFAEAEASPEIMSHKDWYEKEAGTVVKTLFDEYKNEIPGLGQDTVAGILAASSANNVWDDQWRTEGAAGSSNQHVAETILKTWAENRPVTITPEDLALATAFCGSLEKGAYKDLHLPEPGTYSFQALAKHDPRLGYLFNTSWAGADTSGAKPEKVAPESGGGAMGFGGMPGHVIPSLGLLGGKRHDEVFGDEGKVRSFYTNIARSIAGQKDENATLDIWMARAMLDHPGIKGSHFSSFAPTGARYEFLRSVVADLAKKHGMEPKQYQAVVWYAIRGKWDARQDVRDWKAQAKAAKVAAHPRANGKKKGFEPAPDSTEMDDLQFMWLQRYFAHKRGADVSGDPVFGPWDVRDEENARAWEAIVSDASVRKGVLHFVFKGDFEGHPFRGNQWTTGRGAAGEAEGDIVSPSTLLAQIDTLEKDLVKQESQIISPYTQASPKMLEGAKKKAEELRSEIAALEKQLPADPERDRLREAIAEKLADRRATAGDAVNAHEKYLEAKREANALAQELSNAALKRTKAEPTEEEVRLQAKLAEVAPKVIAAKEAYDNAVAAGRAKEAAIETAREELAAHVKSAGYAEPEDSAAEVKEIPLEARAEIAGEVAKSIRESWPDDEKYAKLKAQEEDGIDKRADEIAKPFADQKVLATVQKEQGNREWEEADRKLGEIKDRAFEEAAKAAVTDYLARHPEDDPRSEAGKKVLAEMHDIEMKRATLIDQRTTAANEVRRLTEVIRDKSIDEYARDMIAKYPDLKPEVGVPFSPESLIAEGVARDLEAVGHGNAETEGGPKVVARDSERVRDLIDKRLIERQQDMAKDDAAYQGARAKYQEANDALKPLDKERSDLVAGNSTLLSFTHRLPESEGDSGWTSAYEDLIRNVDTQASDIYSARIAASEAEAKPFIEAKNAAQAKIDDADKMLEEANAKIQGAQQQARDEFAQEAGVGYFARRAMEDDKFYEKNMDELRGAWIHIGGEMPMRVRVATGMGLGLNEGAVYDSDLGRFLKPSDYGDLRDDYKTIQWAGLLQREYLETQEDIAGGALEKVERLGDRHMSGGSSNDADNPEDWDDSKKYDMDKAHEEFYQSDAASDAEYEAMSNDFNNQTGGEKIDDVTGGVSGNSADAERVIEAYVGKLILKEEGVDIEDDAKLKAALVEKLEEADEMDPSKLHEEARAAIISDNLRIHAAANERGAYRRMFAGEGPLARSMSEALQGHDDLRKYIETHQTEIQEALNKLPNSYAGSAYTFNMIHSAFNEQGTIGWTEGQQLTNLVVNARTAATDEESQAAYKLSFEQRQEAGVIEEDEIVARAQELAERNLNANLSEYASDLSKDEVWDKVENEDIDNVLGDLSPKYAGGSMADYAKEQYRESWTWDDTSDAFNSWWEDQDKSEYATEEFNEALASYEDSKSADDEEGDAVDQTPQSGDEVPARDRGYTKVYRGISGNPSDYVPNFVESWSTSRSKARSFGSDTVLEERVPLEQILVFQGARNWKSAGAGAMGEVEFEVMVMSDLPKWYREALREHKRAQARATA